MGISVTIRQKLIQNCLGLLETASFLGNSSQTCCVMGLSRDVKLQVCHAVTRLEDYPDTKQEAVFWVSRFDSERAEEFLLKVINEG